MFTCERRQDTIRRLKRSEVFSYGRRSYSRRPRSDERRPWLRSVSGWVLRVCTDVDLDVDFLDYYCEHASLSETTNC